MKTITINAAQNGTPGVYNENFDTPGFSIVTATASFFIQPGNGQKFKASQGQRVGALEGPALGRLTFSNPTATAIDVTIGDFNSVIQPVPPDLQNVPGVTNLTNPFEYQWWDVAAGTASPFDAGQGFAIPATKPYRRVWCYLDAPTFAWPTGGNLESGCEVNFSLGGSLVHWLPAWFKFLTSPSAFGFATTKDSDNNNRVITPASIAYRNGDGSGTFYQLKPFDIYVAADFVSLVDITSQLGGNIRAFLAVQSSEVPIT